MTPKLSVIFLQYNNAEMTRTAIESFRRWCTVPHEIILLDNASTDTRACVEAEKIPGIRFIHNERNTGFGAGNNEAARSAAGDIYLFINSDTGVDSDFISRVLGHFDEYPKAGIIGPMLRNSDGTFQLSSGSLPSVLQEAWDKVLYRTIDNGNSFFRRWAEKNHRRRTRVGWVTGAALFIRKSVFVALGGFDETFFMYFEDKDLCARAWDAGWEVHYFPETSLMHLRGGSAGKNENPWLARCYRESQVQFYYKHRSWLQVCLVRAYVKNCKEPR
jgi:hypothetical protein